MKASDRIIVLALPAVALVAAFWFLLLSPKREEASRLSDQAAKLHRSVDREKRVVEQGAETKRNFRDSYGTLVRLGKAVPEDDDTATLFVQLSRQGGRAGVDFRSIELKQNTAQAQPPPEPSKEKKGGKAEKQPQGQAPGGTVPASGTATEAAAAGLPIGATIGPAGFPVMPYEVEFRGNFFGVADFLHGVDRQVSTKGGEVAVNGRLLTVDGFNLSRDPVKGFPSLTATFVMTTYVTPPGQGLTGGATPVQPAATAPPSAVSGQAGAGQQATPAPTSAATPGAAGR